MSESSDIGLSQLERFVNMREKVRLDEFVKTQGLTPKRLPTDENYPFKPGMKGGFQSKALNLASEKQRGSEKVSGN
jgi:hypothetical protein